MSEKFDSWKQDLENKASKIEEHGTPPEFSETEVSKEDDEIIATLGNEGWKLVDIITGAYEMDADDHPGKR